MTFDTRLSSSRPPTIGWVSSIFTPDTFTVVSLYFIVASLFTTTGPWALSKLPGYSMGCKDVTSAASNTIFIITTLSEWVGFPVAYCLAFVLSALFSCYSRVVMSGSSFRFLRFMWSE